MGQRTSLKNFFAIICAATLIFTGCGENNSATSAEVKEAIPMKNSVTIQINGKNFSATLEDNPTARAFAEMIPLEVDMTELNGNEKYFYLDKNCPARRALKKSRSAGVKILRRKNSPIIYPAAKFFPRT